MEVLFHWTLALGKKCILAVVIQVFSDENEPLSRILLNHAEFYFMLSVYHLICPSSVSSTDTFCFLKIDETNYSWNKYPTLMAD